MKLLLMATKTPKAAKPPPGPSYGPYAATMVRVIDGDSVDVLADMGGRVRLEMPLRWFGINAPEKNTPEGKLAKRFVETLLPVGSKVLIKTFKNPKDKYGRWLSQIWYNDVLVNDLMLEKGHAVVYFP